MIYVYAPDIDLSSKLKCISNKLKQVDKNLIQNKLKQVTYFNMEKLLEVEISLK